MLVAVFIVRECFSLDTFFGDLNRDMDFPSSLASVDLAASSSAFRALLTSPLVLLAK